MPQKTFLILFYSIQVLHQQIKGLGGLWLCWQRWSRLIFQIYGKHSNIILEHSLIAKPCFRILLLTLILWGRGKYASLFFKCRIDLKPGFKFELVRCLKVCKKRNNLDHLRALFLVSHLSQKYLVLHMWWLYMTLWTTITLPYYITFMTTVYRILMWWLNMSP